MPKKKTSSKNKKKERSSLSFMQDEEGQVVMRDASAAGPEPLRVPSIMPSTKDFNEAFLVWKSSQQKEMAEAQADDADEENDPYLLSNDAAQDMQDTLGLAAATRKNSSKKTKKKKKKGLKQRNYPPELQERRTGAENIEGDMQQPSETAFDMLLGSSHARQPLIESDDDDEEFNYEEYFDDDDDYDDSPLMVALGIPEFLTAPSRGQSRPSGTQEMKEEVQEPPRQKTVDELNQEGIDRVLAENVAINQANAKGGKKVLPDIVDASSILRRHSSRVSHLSSKSMEQSSLSHDRSSDFSLGSISPKRSPCKPRASPLTPRRKGEEGSPSSAFIPSPPPFGSRNSSGSSALDDDDQFDAQAGIPVILSQPGAYAMPGVDREPEMDDSNSLAADYSSVTPHNEQDEEASPSPSRHPEHMDAEVTHTPPRPEPLMQESQVITGELVDFDGLTDEQRKVALRRWRLTHVAIVLCVFMVAAIAAGTAIAVRNKNDSSKAPKAWALVGSELSGPGDDDNILFGTSVSLSGSGKRLAVGLPGIDKSTSTSDVGQVLIFDLEQDRDGLDEWFLSSTIDFSVPQARAGEAVALSSNGRRIVIGSPRWSHGVGQVSVFEEDTRAWSLIGNEIKGKGYEFDGWFGSSVSISEDGRIIAAGAPFAGTGLATLGGIVRAYQQSGLYWVQLGQDIVSEMDDALLGSSIALSADGLRLAVGAKSAGTEIGQVAVYDFNGTHWSQKGKTITGEEDFELFGDDVALNPEGTLLAVGASGSPGSDSRIGSGRVQVFEDRGDAWIQLGGDILGRDAENLGASVAFSKNDILAVGSPQREQGKTGQVKIFSFDRTQGWVQIENTIEGSIVNESFGASVSISSDGNIVAAGAPSSDFDGRRDEVGKARVFENTKSPRTMG